MTRHYVISDTHLGMGRRAGGGWHPLEDFKSGNAFKKFLDAAEDDGVDELIINGDWIDFTQLEPLAYKMDLFSEEGLRLGWTEEESVHKLENCLAGHRGVFDDLRHFLAAGKRLTILQGNHDPELFWGRVQDKLRGVLSPPQGDQLQFVATSVRRGSAHIEHGHQHCSPENKFADPENVFYRCTLDNRTRVELPWGSVFVMEFFNPLEESLPFADNIKPTSRAVWLGIRNGWVGGRTAAKFMKFLLGVGLPWGAVAANVLTARRPPEELIQTINDESVRQELGEVYDRDPGFRREFDEEVMSSTEEEWRAINSPRQQPVTIDDLEPPVNPAAGVLGLFRDGDPEIRGARKLLGGEDVRQVIFGHTHTELDGALADARVRDYFNTGSWVNSLDMKDPRKRARLQSVTREDLSDEEMFDVRLTAAIVEVSEDGRTEVTLIRIVG